MDKSDGAGQLGQDRRDRKGRQDRWDRTGQQGWDKLAGHSSFRVLQLGEDHRDRTARTGESRPDRLAWADRVDKSGNDSNARIAVLESHVQDCWGRIAGTGQLG